MNIHFRKAIRSDVPNIIRLLSNDPLGSAREKHVEPLPQKYNEAAFLDIIDIKYNQDERID